MSDPSASSGAEDVSAALERFERTSRSAMARLQAIQTEITALVPPTVPVAVHAEMDGAGLVTSLTIDATAARALDAETLEGDLTVALKDAARRRPAPDVAEVRAEAESFRASARSQGVDPTDVLRGVLAGSAIEPEPALRWNDRRTVGVTLRAGTVASVTCDKEWLRIAALQEIAAQVRQAVNDAVVRTKGTTEGAQ